MTDDQLEHLFRHHPPSPSKLVRHDRLREAALAFARVLVEVTPNGPDQNAALRHCRNAMMTGNAAIALEQEPLRFSELPDGGTISVCKGKCPVEPRAEPPSDPSRPISQAEAVQMLNAALARLSMER